MSDDLDTGLYETILNEAFAQRLSGIDDELVDRRALRTADASDRIAQYLARELKRGLDSVPDSDRVAVGVGVARRLLNELFDQLPQTAADTADVLPTDQVLHAIGVRRVDGSPSRGSFRSPCRATCSLRSPPLWPSAGRRDLVAIEGPRSQLLPLQAGPVLRKTRPKSESLRLITTRQRPSRRPRLGRQSPSPAGVERSPA